MTSRSKGVIKHVQKQKKNWFLLVHWMAKNSKMNKQTKKQLFGDAL